MPSNILSDFYKNVTEESLVISAVKRTTHMFRSLEIALCDLRINKRFHKVVMTSLKFVRRCAKESFAGKLTDQNRKPFFDISDSRLVVFCAAVNGYCVKKISAYYNQSALGIFIQSVVTSFVDDSLKAVGMVVIVAVLINAAICFALGIQPGMFAWLIRILFILAGIAALTGNVGMKELKRASYFVRFFVGYGKK